MKQNTVYKERELWIDFTKGIAIICIVWQHCSIASNIHSWIASFDVPVFLIITGYLLTKNDRIKKASIKNDAKKYLLPYIYFSLISIVVEFVFLVLSHKSWAGAVLVYIYKTLSGFGILALWFIPSFFFAKYIFVFIRKKISNNYLLLLVFVFIVFVAIIIERMLVLIKTGIGNTYIYDIIYYPVAGIGRTLICSFFILVGFLSKSLIDFFKKKHIVFVFVTSIILLFGSFALASLCWPFNISMLELSRLPLVLLCSGIIGSYGLMLLSIVLEKVQITSRSMICYFGVNSIVVMLTHMSLKLHVVSTFIVDRLLNCNHFIKEIIGTIIVLIVELFIIYVINNYFGFLIAKNSNSSKKIKKIV